METKKNSTLETRKHDFEVVKFNAETCKVHVHVLGERERNEGERHQA